MADSTTDVLIIGAGPAGLMASMYLAEMGIPFRIIDKRSTRTLNGRADGFHSRTLEIWDSFGIADKLHKHGVHLGQWTMWNPDPDDVEAGITRNRELIHGVERTVEAIEAQSGTQFKPYAIHQGFIEAAMIQASRERGGSKVERGTVPVSIEVQDTMSTEYPVKVKVRHLTKSELASPRTGAHRVEADGSLKPERGYIDAFGEDPDEIVPSIGGAENVTETIRAKYLIGADGARSWVRNQIGFTLEGEETDAIWGAIDIKPLTDFPDIRKVSSIFSQHGAALLIPRELGLVRVYVHLPDDYDLRNGYEREEAVKDIMSTARKILAPYTIDYKYCDWFTVYPVAQKICENYSFQNRIFLAGDAVHTHSPKGGQGQNVSQQDTYNLAFKLAAVLRGQMPSSVLSTYQSERLPVAHDLIELDQLQGRVMDSRAEQTPDDVKLMVDRMLLQGGTGVKYRPSALIAGPDHTHQDAAKNLEIGVRVSDVPVFRQSNAMSTGLQSLLPSTGLWRLLVFAGDVTNPKQLKLVNSLNGDLKSLLGKYRSASARQPDNFMEILTFHAGSVNDVESAHFESAFFPYHPVEGHNYETIFGDYSGIADAGRVRGSHQVFGVDPNRGALVVVRPDQVAAWVGYLTDFDLMLKWFSSFMIPRVLWKL